MLCQARIVCQRGARWFAKVNGYVTIVRCQFFQIPVIPQKSFVTRGFEYVGMWRWQFQCPYRYALNKRECPRDAKLFYGITENKKSANTHKTQTFLAKLYKIEKSLCEYLTQLTFSCKMSMT